MAGTTPALAELFSPAQPPGSELPEDRGQRGAVRNFTWLVQGFRAALFFDALFHSSCHFRLLASCPSRTKSIFKKVNIIGISLRMVTACQWLVINSTFDTIDDKVIDLIILYFGFTSLAQSLQNMNDDPFTV